jgi:hypothetical protein
LRRVKLSWLKASRFIVLRAFILSITFRTCFLAVSIVMPRLSAIVLFESPFPNSLSTSTSLSVSVLGQNSLQTLTYNGIEINDQDSQIFRFALRGCQRRYPLSASEFTIIHCFAPWDFRPKRPVDSSLARHANIQDSIVNACL